MDILFKAYFKVFRHGSKKNEKKIRRAGQRIWIGSSDKATECEKWMLRYLVKERIQQKIDTPISCDINCKFTFYYPKTVYFTKKGERNKTIGDLDNLNQLPLDCLQKVGIIINDTIVCGFDGTRREPIEGSDYFLKIELSKYNG